MEKNPVVTCRYNLFDEGRKYSGNHRRYVLESARKVAESPRTREDVRLRELIGYFGHGRRIFAGKLKLDEVERVKLPDGSFMVVENIPSNVCTELNIHDDGTVEHHEEFLLGNKPGQIAYGLHKDRIGGFSWAMSQDQATLENSGQTAVTRLFGFDYVMNPGFVKSRGFVLESAEQSDMLLESIAKAANLDDAEARERLNSWIASEAMVVPHLRRRIDAAIVTESALRAERDETADALESARAEIERLEGAEKARREAVLEGAGRTVVAIPDDVQHALMNLESANDFERVVGFFETAGRVDLGMIVPKDAHGRKREIYVTPPDKYHPADDDEHRNGMRLSGSLFLD